MRFKCWEVNDNENCSLPACNVQFFAKWTGKNEILTSRDGKKFLYHVIINRGNNFYYTPC